MLNPIITTEHQTPSVWYGFGRNLTCLSDPRPAKQQTEDYGSTWLTTSRPETRDRRPETGDRELETLDSGPTDALTHGRTFTRPPYG